MEQVRPNNFTYEALEVLYDYLDQLSHDIDKPIEFDPIGLCCEYTEYGCLEELQQDYPDIKNMEDLEDWTTVIRKDNSDGFLIVQY